MDCHDYFFLVEFPFAGPERFLLIKKTKIDKIT